MKYKIALISDEPVDTDLWPFEDIQVNRSDKTYIIVKGRTENLKSIINYLGQLIPNKIVGLAVTVEAENPITFH